jgi:hypothetical protein
MPLSDAQLGVVARRYQDLLARLSARTADQVGVLWDRAGGIDDAAQAQFARRAADLVAASQRQAAMLADAYIRTYALGLDGTVVGAAVDLAAAVGQRGVDPLEVYSRPTITARKALADGREFADALQAARLRAASTADMDVKLAARAAARDAMVAAGYTRYRRVPDATACTFCLTASTQAYRTVDLMPLHARCGCAVAPLPADAPLVIDRDLLDRLKASSGRDDYWNDRRAAIAIREHGELGPVLTAKSHAFTGPGDIAA